MKQDVTLLNVVRIVREFMEHEAQTIEISKGKMLNDKDIDLSDKRALRTG